MDSRKLAQYIREDALLVTSAAKASHIGSILSVADIVAVLYSRILTLDSNCPNMANRDRFVLSKGHAGVSVYAALAELGFYPKEDFLNHYYQDGSPFSGHISHKNIPGVEVSTGSLGHGIGMACGMALSAKLKNDSYKVFVIVGDGECEEGSVWEVALFAAQHALDNFFLIVDRNNQQSFGHCDETALDLGNLNEKFAAFGWDVEDVDGHNHDMLTQALSSLQRGKPHCIIAHTTKGKGVSFMEDNVAWHYKDVQGDLLEQALREVRNAHA